MQTFIYRGELYLFSFAHIFWRSLNPLENANCFHHEFAWNLDGILFELTSKHKTEKGKKYEAKRKTISKNTQLLVPTKNLIFFVYNGWC